MAKKVEDKKEETEEIKKVEDKKEETYVVIKKFKDEKGYHNIGDVLDYIVKEKGFVEEVV